jgi:hypothetical protein
MQELPWLFAAEGARVTIVLHQYRRKDSVLTWTSQETIGVRSPSVRMRRSILGGSAPLLLAARVRPKAERYERPVSGGQLDVSETWHNYP